MDNCTITWRAYWPKYLLPLKVCVYKQGLTVLFHIFSLWINLIRRKSYTYQSHLWCFRFTNSQHLSEVGIHSIVSFTLSLRRLNPTWDTTSLNDINKIYTINSLRIDMHSGIGGGTGGSPIPTLHPPKHTIFREKKH